MTTITVEIDNKTMSYVSKNHKDVNTYLYNLIKEDILLNNLKESKLSGINKLNSLDDLDY